MAYSFKRGRVVRTADLPSLPPSPLPGVIERLTALAGLTDRAVTDASTPGRLLPKIREFAERIIRVRYDAILLDKDIGEMLSREMIEPGQPAVMARRLKCVQADLFSLTAELVPFMERERARLGIPAE